MSGTLIGSVLCGGDIYIYIYFCGRIFRFVEVVSLTGAPVLRMLRSFEGGSVDGAGPILSFPAACPSDPFHISFVLVFPIKPAALGADVRVGAEGR